MARKNIAYYNRKPEIGDYVLASKYHDGDTGDHFCVGWLQGYLPKGDEVRFDIVDNNGKLFRRNGFRRIKVITAEAGEYIVNHFKEMERTEGSISVWGWLRIAAKELQQQKKV